LLKIANLINSSPGALDTLNELAAALGNDPNFATTVTNALANKAATAGSYPGLSVGFATNSDTVDGYQATDLLWWWNQTGKPAGADIPFNFSMQTGQPTGVWGGNDTANAYVYNPQNFNVYHADYAGYANNAGNADTLDGYHASQMWRDDRAAGGQNWFKLPNGWIIQIGKSPAQSLGARPITFPIAFPNSVIFVSGTKSHPTTSGVTPGTAWSTNTASLTGFTAGINDNAYDFFWIAIGN
jgi:hypothetical protein